VTTPLFESSIRSLTLLGRGKVRDIYAIDADTLLIVTSDRLSAFDVILPDPIPRKGEVLTAMANFWFAKLGHIVPNQLTGIDPESVVAADERIRCAAARWWSSASPRCPSRPWCVAT
jgi:phosphoribosylaminoimidazole-succinocarboxamide synthase